MAAADLTQERLKALVHYDPETGAFTRLSGPYAGQQAGNIRIRTAGSQKGEPQCIQLILDGYMRTAHRLAWLYVYGTWPKGVIDHIDQNPLNNRIANLRDVSQRTNLQNSRRHRDNTSGMTGVRRVKRGWAARICVDYVIRERYFASFREAAAQRRVWERQFGFSKRHGTER